MKWLGWALVLGAAGLAAREAARRSNTQVHRINQHKPTVAERRGDSA